MFRTLVRRRSRNRVDCKAVAHDRTKDIDCSVEADPDDAWT